MSAGSAFVRALPAVVTAEDIAARLPGTRIDGDPQRRVQGIAGIGPGAPQTLAFCDLPPVAERVARSPCAVIIVAADAMLTPRADQTLIRAPDPRVAFILAVESLLPGSSRLRAPGPGVDPLATVARDADIAPTAAIGARVTIGSRTQIGPGVVIHDDCVIGADVVIGPNAVIGWVGLAWHIAANGERHPMPHLGGVRIGDATDIGACTCVCRGILSDTVIGRQVKIGSLVYVSHGVVIDDGAWLSASVAVAGHAHVGADALLGIAAVVVDNVDVAGGVLVGGGSVVARDAPTGAKLVGVPGRHLAAMKRFGPTPR
jgi:UDP-3-O-[3-hydroxymyristoyl] glucosamine N-acyltransferase